MKTNTAFVEQFPASLRRLEVNGGRVTTGPPYRLTLPVVRDGYADAQLDDYGSRDGGRSNYPWRAGIRLTLRARFSHAEGRLLGTAGFGFWNAPFGDPTVPWPALPRAAWFFYGSPPTDLPLAAQGAGRGWFAATLDATTRRAVTLAPLAPLVLLLNRRRAWQRRIWPWVRSRLGIDFAPLGVEMVEWHTYEIEWGEKGCFFRVDNRVILEGAGSPQGAMGFVCWLDNQYLVAKSNGRFRWGTLPIPQEQWLQVSGLQLVPL